MKLLWLSITFLGGSENQNFFSRQNKLAFWEGCREKRGWDTLVFRPDLSYLGSRYPGYKFSALYLTLTVLKMAFESTNYSTTWIARTWRGVAPKLWRAEISKQLWIGIFQFACVHSTYRCALEINFSQIWEVTQTNSQDFGWFDTEWSFYIFAGFEEHTTHDGWGVPQDWKECQ